MTALMRAEWALYRESKGNEDAVWNASLGCRRGGSGGLRLGGNACGRVRLEASETRKLPDALREDAKNQYENWEIFVHSNQPNRSAEARSSNGDHWSYETNSEGYADIYLYVHGDADGQQVTVDVGEATCSTVLD